MICSVICGHVHRWLNLQPLDKGTEKQSAASGIGKPLERGIFGKRNPWKREILERTLSIGLEGLKVKGLVVDPLPLRKGPAPHP